MYKLNSLPYSYEALEPFIDTHTLGLHYNKHQKGYLDKLNNLLIKNKYDFKYPIEHLASDINMFKKEDIEDILFNLGGVLNHAIYFRSMSSNRQLPSDKFLNKINKYFGNYDNFKQKFKEAALSIKGSGYTFLVLNNNDELMIINLFNQDSPYFYNLVPIVAIDMWEHAYYINYENQKSVYIDNFFDVVDFSLANQMYNTEKFKNFND